MKIYKNFVSIVGIFFVVHYVYAVPPGERLSSCSKTECPNISKFRYTPGKSYSYRYDVDVTSFVDGVSGAKESRFHLSAKVHFDVQTPCEWTLRVKDVTLQDSEPLDATRKTSVPGESAFKEALEKSDLSFTFHDGAIPFICPTKDDPIWSVNIKRGILSAFQNTMVRFDLDHEALETDVSGTCKIDYAFYGAVQNTINVLKTRDFSSCTNRYDQGDSLSGVPYRFLGAAYHHIPLTNSTGSCQQTIAGHRITQSDCEEKHVVRPFSHEGSGATTSVRQLLVFLDEMMIEDDETNDSAKARDNKIRARTSLIYHHSQKDSVENVDGELTLRSTLQRLCQNTEDGVESGAASSFGRLVKTLKTMDYQTLGQLMTEANTLCRDGDAARRHLINGLISAASSDAIAAMRDEVLTGKVDDALVNRWITSLAFIPRPTEKHLKAAMPLLDVTSLFRRVSLSLSSLARKLCTPSCGSEVHLFVGKLSKLLGNSCQTRSREEQEEVIFALKSLSNVGEAVSGDHFNTIKNCFLDKDNSAEVRISALKVFRNVPCRIRGDAALKIFEDVSEDSEIRIVAYLAVMKCVDYHTVLKIKDLLAIEEINQVGSFVWTHLKNLATSSLPSKLDIQGLILDQALVKKFDTDGRKYSRNYEKSILLDQYNTAAGLESNIIFSQQSYLPRSTSLNLTVDIFGQSVNLLELDGRFEGFENYIESLFGPGGPYQQKEVGALLEGLRSKRKVNSVSPLNAGKLSKMDEQFDAGGRFTDEPEMSLSMKVFGNEFGYGRWEGKKEIADWVRQLSPIYKLHNLMNGEEKRFSYSAQYIDSNYVIPLSVGLPLSLMARGQVVADIRGSMRTDLKSILSRGQGEIIWRAHPSAVVNFDGSMIVDAVAAKTGITLEATLHSSTSTSGKFSLAGFKLFDLQIDLPQEKAEIVTFKSDIILHHRTAKESLPGILENRVDSSDCTRGVTQRYLGLQICSQIAYPNASENAFVPNFPLTGPSHFSIELVKADPSIKSYRFLHKIEDKETLKSWVLSFKPEGAKESKEIGVKAKLEFKDAVSGDLGFSLMLPSNSYETKGTFKWKNETKTIEASFLRDSKVQLLVAKASLSRSSCSKQTGTLCYQPKLTLTLKDKKLIDLGGEIKSTEKKGTNKYEVNLDSTVGAWKTVSKGYYLVDEKSHLCNLTVDYSFSPSDRPETVKIEIKVNKEASSTIRQYDMHLEVEPSAYPNRNFIGTWRLQKGDGHFENALSMNIGPTPRDNRNSLTILQGFSYAAASNPHNLKFKSNFEMALPAKELDIGFVISHEQSDYKTDSLFVGRYASGKEVRLGMLLHKKPGILFQANGAFNLTLPSQPIIRFSGVVQEQFKNNYKVDIDGVWGQETDFQLSGSFDNRARGSNFNQQLTVSVTGSSIYPTEFVYTFQTNSSAMEIQLQTSYGKDAMSLFLLKENLTPNEMKMVTKVGYLTYLHTVESYLKYMPDSQKATIDIHLDKVIDARGDLGIDIASNGRRDFSLDIQWDPNRNPQQKLTLKSSYEPSSLNQDDWKRAFVLSYPGVFYRGNFAALTQQNNRSLSGTIDQGTGRPIHFLAFSVKTPVGLRSELDVKTPYKGWERNNAVFTVETKDLHHKTMLKSKWGPSGFFEIGVDALVKSSIESKKAEVSLGWKSSSEQFEDFLMVTEIEVLPKIVETSVKLQLGKNQSIKLQSTLEWSFDGQVMIKSNTGLTSSYPQLTQVNLELLHNTEWESAQLFETKATLLIDQQKYTMIVKGENPSISNRWEASATITTPHPSYSIIGITSQYTANENQPSFNLGLNWPGKEFSISAVGEISNEGQHRGRFQMKTPFQQFHQFEVDGSFSSPSDLTVFKLDLGTRWNVEEFTTFNATWDIESLIDSDLSIDVKTSFPGYENYGGKFKFNLDLAEYSSVNSLVFVSSPTNRIGFSANGSMTETEGGPSIDATVMLEISDFPKLSLEISHETKDGMGFKSSIHLSRGEQSINLNAVTTTTADGFFIASLSATTPLLMINEAEVRIRFLKNMTDEANAKMVYEGGLKWKESDQENKVNGRLFYESLTEEVDFMDKSSTSFEVMFSSPWQAVQRLSVKGKLVSENAEMTPQVEAILNNQSFTLTGNVNFIDQLANMALTRKIAGPNKPFAVRMNTTWALDDNQIKVEGTIGTSVPGFSRIPWNLEITMIDSEDDENVWERLVRGEARLTNSQFIMLNAAWLPTKMVASVATPFQTFKNVNLTIDFEKPGDSAMTIAGEFRVNEDLMEVTINYDWPQDNVIPVSIHFAVNTPYEYELITLTWTSEDPLVGAELVASLNKKNQPNNIQLRYRIDEQSVDIDLKLEMTVGSQSNNWALHLNSTNLPERIAGRLTISTPLPHFKSAEITLSSADASPRVTAAQIEKTHKISIILDTKSLSGKLKLGVTATDRALLKIDAALEILQYCQFNLKLDVSPDTSNVSLDASAVWDPTLVQWQLKSKFERITRRKHVWSSELSADSDRKWLLDLDLDFENVNDAYGHKIRYQAVHDNVLYSTYGSLTMNDILYKGHLGFDWGAVKPLEIKFTNKKLTQQLGNAVIEIISPWSEEHSAVIDFTVDGRQQPIEFKISSELADRTVIISTNIKYNSLVSMAINTLLITTYSWMPRAALNLNTHSARDIFNGSYTLEWSNDNLFDVYVFRQEKDSVSLLKDKDIVGAVQVKTSWNKLPEASVRYGRLHTTPYSFETDVKVSHNSTDLINVLYKSNDKASAGHELNQSQLEFRGLFSGGLAFSRDFRYSGGMDGDNLPRSLNRSVEVFQLGKRPKFAMRAEVYEKETLTGQEYVVKLSSPYRTIEFLTHMDFPDGVFRHGSEFRWRPDAKIAYDINIENKTTAVASDYVMTTSLLTPVRDIGLTGKVHQTRRNLRAIGEVVWDLKRRESVAKVIVTYENTTKTRDVEASRLKIGFSQGNLPQELAVTTEVRRSAMHPLSMRTEINYSNQSERKLVFDTLVTKRPGNYRYEMNMTHKATQLELKQVMTYDQNTAGRIQLVHLFSHSRSDAELMVLEHLFTVDQQEKRVFFSASSPMMTLRNVGQLKQMDGITSVTYEIQQDESATRNAELTLNHKLPFAQFYAQYDPENMQGLHLKAGLQDRRQMILELFNMDNQERVPLFDFNFRLNHSRLVTSKTHWQTDWRNRLASGVERTKNALALTADQWVSAFILSSFSEAAGSVLIIADDIALVLDTALSNFLDEIEKLHDDVLLMRQNIIDGYYGDAFFARLTVEISAAIIKDIPFGSYAQSIVAFIEKTGNRLLAPFTNEEDSFSNWIKRIGPYFHMLSDTITSWAGEQWKWPTQGSSKVLAEINAIFQRMAEEYDRFIKQLNINLWDSMPEVWAPLRTLLRNSWNGFYEIARPVLLRSFIAVESAVWNVMKEVLDYFYQHRESVIQSSYFQKLSYLVEDLKQFYSDMQSTDWPTKIRQYLTRAGQFLKEKYTDIDGYVTWLLKLQKELDIIYQGFLKENPELQRGAESWQKFITFLQWSYNHLDINQKFSDLIVVLRERGEEILGQTATDAQMRHTLQKTMFRFQPEIGLIELEQKLPFPWISLDETPLYDQLPEIQRVRSFLSIFEPSNSSSLDTISSYLPKQQRLSDWLPPFKSSAHLVGLQHFTTFDGRHFDFVGPCTYLLARDFVTKNFTLAVQYIGARGKPFASVLHLVIDDAQWDLDLGNRSVRVAGIGRALPTDERGTVAFFEHGQFVIESPTKGIRLQCIVAYDACTLSLSGWYNNKVAGLLGTIDNEPSTDLIRPNRVVELDLTSLAQSWDVSAKPECKTVENLARKMVPVDDKLTETCNNFFRSQRSTLKKCLSVVDPAPYWNMCVIKTRSRSTDQDGCHSAAAYISACAAKGVFLRIPPQCVRCQMGSEFLLEGDSKDIKSGSSDRTSSDIVVILDLKKCNEPDGSSRRFLPSLVNNLEKELIANKILKNRYSLVVFGGRYPYDTPRVRTLHGQEFVTVKEMDNLFQNLSYGNGPNTVLDAFKVASRLNFRPGVSKTFVLLPCSSCETSQDNEFTLQSFMENDVTLHVLIDSEFRFIKANVSRQFLGLDATTGFTTKELKGRLVGDMDLRRQARLPKSVLGSCAPLALATNGTIFTASRLRDQRKNSAESKRAVNVWVKRVASTARPTECQKCTCQLKNYYESILDCRICIRTRTPVIDESFLVDEAASLLRAS